MKFCINLIATNKYLKFVPGVLASIEKHFFVGSDITVIIHTNVDAGDIFSSQKNISVFVNKIEHEGWPFVTLKRFHYFTQAKKKIQECDYAFYVDVDSLFIGDLNLDSIGQSGIFATLHPCLYDGEGTPERNPLSSAYIPYNSGNSYFCGGFFGGSAEDFMEMSEQIILNIESDLGKGLIAIWHDESHLNKYLFENKPSVVFKPPFAVAENITTESEASKIKFLDKNSIGGHDYFRN
jgi:hypothetical protein